jgi:hypothetical protein
MQFECIFLGFYLSQGIFQMSQQFLLHEQQSNFIFFIF